LCGRSGFRIDNVQDAIAERLNDAATTPEPHILILELDDSAGLGLTAYKTRSLGD